MSRGATMVAPAREVRMRATLPYVLAALALAVVVGGRLADARAVAEVENFVVLFTSIAVEALPFVLIGATVSAAIAVFVSERTFMRVAALPTTLQMPGAVAAGFAFPVCECGSVPVARRLMARGLAPTAALTFMLAAPVVNPIVIASTAIAYSGRDPGQMVAGRVGLGIAVAVALALLLGRGRGAEVIAARAASIQSEPHDHGGRRAAFLEHLAADFSFMGKFVVAGAALAAALQTAVSQSVFTGVLASPLVACLLLMGLAFLLSLCSEADAFVAVSFVQFPLSAQLAFLVFGPMLDLKLALLYGASFGKAFVLRLLLAAVPLVLIGAALFHFLTT